MPGKPARVVLLSLTFSIAAFSYAIATTPASREVSAAHALAPARATLDFCNPFVPSTTDRDLGDAVPGKFFRRFVRAKGGVPPYRFTAGSLDSTVFAFYRSGLFTVPFVNKVRIDLPTNFPVGPLRFMTTVKELGTSGMHTEPFRLNIVSDTTFRFAIGPALSDATQYRHYADQVGVINQNLPITFALSGSVFLDGVAQPSLASLGLALGKHDGLIFGQPLKSGTISFTVTCTDANGNVALSRDGTTTSQTLSIKVDPNKLLANDALCRGLKVKLGSGSNTGTLSYTGVINLGGKVSDLAGKPVQLRLGNFVSPEGVFDTNGTATNLNSKGKPKKGGTAVIIAKVSGSGSVTVTVTNGDFALTDLFEETHATARSVSSADDTISGRSAVVGGIVGDSYLDQVVNSSSSSTSSLDLSGDTSTAGGFIVVNTISGHDDKTQLGDKWRVSFMGTPPAGIELDQTASVQITVGNLANTLTSTVNGTSIRALNKVDSTTRNAVMRFAFNTRTGKGTFTTTYLDAAVSGIPVSGSNSPNTPNFTTQVDFNDSTATPTLSGADSLTIFPKTNAWTSTAPK